MGRIVETYMFHKEYASTNLYEDLKDKRLYQKTFNEFLYQRRADFGSDSNIIFDKILSDVYDDINYIGPDDLYRIVLYLNNELEFGKFENLMWGSDRDLHLKSQQEIGEIYENYGIILLDEIHSKTTCASYMNQLHNFMGFFPIKAICAEGFNLRSEDFLMFNDYIVLITHSIIKSGICDFDINRLGVKSNEIEKVILKYKNNQKMHQCIEYEFNILKSCLSEEQGSCEVEKNTVYAADTFLDQALEMKQRINPRINPRIVIIDD